MLTRLYTFGKYLDQPAIVKNLSKNAPKILVGGAVGYGIYDTFQEKKQNRPKTFFKNLCILTGTVLGAIWGTRGLRIGNRQIIKGITHAHGCHHGHSHAEHILKKLKAVMPETSKTFNELKDTITKISHEKYVKLKDIFKLNNHLEKNYKGEKLISELIHDPHAHGTKDILSEMSTLSYLGLVPVLGGMAGGVIGDKITGEDWKKHLPDKIKEGSYQYLANIFLCNVGAGAAMIGLDKLGVKSKMAKLAGAIGGVMTVGVIFGSQIANLFGKKVINPMLENKKIQTNKSQSDDFVTSIKKLNNERHPELLDVSLHLDDMAAVGFLSGLKWIGPVLPLFYSVSAYRAGIGYRNGEGDEPKSNQIPKFYKINESFKFTFEKFLKTK